MTSLSLVLMIAMLSALCLAGCGQAGKGSGSQATEAALRAKTATVPKTLYAGDVDAEEDRDGRDADDQEVLGFGQRAAGAETRTVAVLVKRYYAAAVRFDGKQACSMLYSTTAEAVPEDYGEKPGPAYLRGKTCATVMAKLFKHDRRQLSAAERKLKVTEVRVAGNRGVALLDLGAKPERHMLVHREFGVWKIGAFMDAGMP